MNFKDIVEYVKENPVIWSAIIIVLITGLILLISGIAIVYMWIKHSWIKRENSKNYTGADISKKILDKGDLKDTKIKSSFFYIKYWNYNKRKNTYKLRPWTHDRRSVWTMMEAAQQAWVATLRGRNKKQYWMIFRLPIVFKILGAVIGLVATILAYYMFLDAGGWKTLNAIHSKKVLFWLDISIGFSVGAILFMVAEVGKIYLIRKNVVPYITKLGLNPYELKTIQRIYTWKMVYAVSQALLELVKLILRVVARSSGQNKNRN